MSLSIRFGFLLFLVVFVQTKCFAQSVADELLPYKKSPRFRASGISFAPIYKGSTPGNDTVQLRADLPSTPTVIFGDVGNDLKIVLDGKTGEQSVNMMILYLHGLDRVTWEYDSITITYELRSKAVTRVDHGFSIASSSGQIDKSEDTVIIDIPESVLRGSRFKYWSVSEPGYTTGAATSAIIGSGASIRFQLLSRGKLIDPDWLAGYTENRSCYIHGIEFDMFNRYYYGDSTNTTTVELSRSGTFYSAEYSADWGQLSAVWENVSPNMYPVNVYRFTLTGLDTSTLHADELSISHGYQEGGQFHYDWGYSVSVKDVSITKTEREFAIVLSADKLREGSVSFGDHIAPLHRWGSSINFRVKDGAGVSIRAFRPIAKVSNETMATTALYPNPCFDRLIVSDERRDWWVINTLGDRISLPSPAGAQVDVSSLTTGVYMLMSAQGEPRRFVKAR
ncbi:MAG TPA: hypothetical protein VFH43_00475 [Candidatus Kapabacteria bacterium]|nr:hypothetical protein [Candidatus Kapabacteria bacterium]